ncbi:hypothetical protein BLOT_009217 [Blomia tropicalis]|nr:hypothetical protein BLOT_009217 [Blomia tropicalis]
MKPHDYKKKLEDNKRISNYRLSRPSITYAPEIWADKLLSTERKKASKSTKKFDRYLTYAFHFLLNALLTNLVTKCRKFSSN